MYLYVFLFCMRIIYPILNKQYNCNVVDDHYTFDYRMIQYGIIVLIRLRKILSYIY